MKFENRLILEEGDEYTFAQLNPNIKFSTVLEEVIYTLLILFILNYTPTLTNCVNLLCKFLDRSDRAIGFALKSLTDLGLIDYYRSGRGRVIELQLDHPYLKSALFRIFGFNDWLADEQNEKNISITQPIGFLPSEKNVQKFLTFIQKQEQKIIVEIAECQIWLEWSERIEKTIAYAKDQSQENPEDFEDNPIQLFAEEVVSRIKKKEVTRVNQLRFDELKEIILEIFKDKKEIPPWLDDTFLSPFSCLMDDFLEESHND